MTKETYSTLACRASERHLQLHILLSDGLLRGSWYDFRNLVTGYVRREMRSFWAKDKINIIILPLM